MPSARWREQYDRVMRWHARITEATVVDERHLDDLHAFLICCHHLKDWLSADPTLDGAVKRGAQELVRHDEWLRLSADLANGSKHLVLNRWWTSGIAHLDKTEWAVELKSGPGFAIRETFDVPVVRGAHGEQVAITVADRCVAAWNAFLGERTLLGP